MVHMSSTYYWHMKHMPKIQNHLHRYTSCVTVKRNLGYVYLQYPCEFGLPVRDMARLVCGQALYDFSQRGKRQIDAFALGERVPRVGADSCVVNYIRRGI